MSKENVKRNVIRIDDANYNWLVELAHTEQSLNGVLTDIRLARTKSNANLKNTNKGGNNETKRS